MIYKQNNAGTQQPYFYKLIQSGYELGTCWVEYPSEKPRWLAVIAAEWSQHVGNLSAFISGQSVWVHAVTLNQTTTIWRQTGSQQVTCAITLRSKLVTQRLGVEHSTSVWKKVNVVTRKPPNFPSCKEVAVLYLLVWLSHVSCVFQLHCFENKSISSVLYLTNKYLDCWKKLEWNHMAFWKRNSCHNLLYWESILSISDSF